MYGLFMETEYLFMEILQQHAFYPWSENPNTSVEAPTQTTSATHKSLMSVIRPLDGSFNVVLTQCTTIQS